MADEAEKKKAERLKADKDEELGIKRSATEKLLDAKKDLSDAFGNAFDPEHLQTHKERSDRITKMMNDAAERAPPRVVGCLKACAPAISGLIRVVLICSPLFVAFYTFLYKVYRVMPTNLVTAVIGLGLCFYGSSYGAAIAAIEAARQFGLRRCQDHILSIYEEVKNLDAASKADDLKDEDGDGSADVSQLAPQDLFFRKLSLGLRVVKDPEKLQSAVGALFMAYIAVMATLQVDFARGAALALGMAEVVQGTTLKAFGPTLANLMRKDQHHWIEVIIDTAVTLPLILIGWNFASIMMPLYCGVRGGRLFADGILKFLTGPFVPERIKLDPSIVDDLDDKYIMSTDELLGYGLAGLGFVCQMFSLFDNGILPFPLDWVLWPFFAPLDLIHWYLMRYMAPTCTN